MPTHGTPVMTSTVLSDNAAHRIDPTSPNANRYKVPVINTSLDTRIFVGFANTVTPATGFPVEPDFGVAPADVTWIDSTTQLWAIRATTNLSGGAPSSVTVITYECATP